MSAYRDQASFAYNPLGLDTLLSCLYMGVGLPQSATRPALTNRFLLRPTRFGHTEQDFHIFFEDNSKSCKSC